METHFFKIDKKKTRNKPIKMTLQRMKILYTAFEGDENPAISKISGKSFHFSLF